MGSVAIVGCPADHRLHTGTQVSNWQAADKPYCGSIQLSSAQARSSGAVLDDQVLRRGPGGRGERYQRLGGAGEAGLSSLNSEASQCGFSTGSELTITRSMPQKLFQQVGRLNAEVMAYELKRNGGKAPITQMQETNISNKVNSARSRSTSRSARSSASLTTRCRRSASWRHGQRCPARQALRHRRTPRASPQRRADGPAEQPRVAPGLLTWQAWSALRAASRVLAPSGHAYPSADGCRRGACGR
jgi:hypothetical protein